MLQSTNERDDTLEVVWNGRLTRSGCRRVGVPEGIDLDGRRVGLNLRSVSFVTPFGLVFLYWYVRDLVDNRGVREIVVAEPQDDGVATYLLRMRFPHAFRDDDRVQMPELEDRSINRRDRSTELVELETLHVDHDNEVHRQAERLIEVILAQSEVASERKYEVWYTLSEVLSNIQVHSETREAALAVQSYRNGLELAFGDGGVGIPSKMAGHPALPDDPTDADIIRTAMERTVTSRRDLGGTGLSDLREIAVEAGRLAIRSGDGEVEVTEIQNGPSDRLRSNCGDLRGTLVGVRLEPSRP